MWSTSHPVVILDDAGEAAVVSFSNGADGGHRGVANERSAAGSSTDASSTDVDIGCVDVHDRRRWGGHQ